MGRNIKTNSLKIFAVCKAFRVPSTYVRWKLLASQNQDVNITLFGPQKFIDKDWSTPSVKSAERISEHNFSVIPINMESPSWFTNGFVSYDFLRLIIKEKPDVVYLIGFEVDNLIYVLFLIKKIFFLNFKIIGFTMRGLEFPLENTHFKLRWFFSRKIFDAIFCHYPKGLKILTEQGSYKGQVFMQTQIGVNCDDYFPNKNARDEIRKKYGISQNEFVFGTASRIDDSKGIFEVIQAMVHIPNAKLLVLGDGIEYDKLKRLITSLNLEDRVINVGYIPMGIQVGNYMNAMDCFIHFPKTTINWIDTFPVAVVQAMSVGLPVIGSNSGAVPYQINNKELIIEEQDLNALINKMKELSSNIVKCKELGEEMKIRVMSCFEIRHLNRYFLATIKELISGKISDKYIDQTK